MVEFSLTELALFCWAVIATGYAFRYKHHANAADFFIKAILERKDLRERMVADYERAMAE
jgi:hypothetical protein